jgi:4'-phosphopantetheinyl transferase
MAAVLWLGEVFGGAEGRHQALRAFCAAALRVGPERVTLARDAFSAPLLSLNGAPSLWRLSSASRENIALFGLARERIGVDVEVANGAPEPPWNVLHEAEKAALRALPEELRAEEFLRIWTGKEAYLKALGLGLRREPAEIGVLAGAENFTILDRGREVATREARFWREKIGRSQVFCACVVLPASG